MANQNTVFGARLQDLSWTGGSVMRTPCIVSAGDAVALFKGDFVTLTGESEVWTDGRYYPVVTQTAAGGIMVGFVDDFEVHPDFLNLNYRFANTKRLVYLIDHPLALFEIQSTGTGASGDIGQTANIIVGSGNVITGLSGMQLDHGSLTDNLQLKIVGLSPRINSEFGAYTKFLCKINTNKDAYLVSTGV